MIDTEKTGPVFERLNVFIENQDWVAIEGTPSDFETLGRLLLEFAKAEDQGYLILDALPPSFIPGSLGLTFYRRSEQATTAEPSWTKSPPG